MAIWMPNYWVVRYKDLLDPEVRKWIFARAKRCGYLCVVNVPREGDDLAHQLGRAAQQGNWADTIYVWWQGERQSRIQCQYGMVLHARGCCCRPKLLHPTARTPKWWDWRYKDYPDEYRKNIPSIPKR